MNKHLQEAFLKQKIRREIRRKLSKSKSLNEEASLYSAFVEPFTDVLLAVQLGTEDLLNSYITYLRMFITWDPKKAEALLKAHDQRRDAIASKWSTLMERNNKALSTGDADVLAMVFAPGAYAISAVASTGAEYGGAIGAALDAAGLGGFIGGLIPGYEMKFQAAGGDSDSGGSILDKIEMLFLGTAAVAGIASKAKDMAAGEGLDTPPKDESGSTSDKKEQKKESVKVNKSVLKEQDEKFDFEKDFKEFIGATGVKDELDKTKKDLFDLLKTDVEKFEKIHDQKIVLFEGIDKSKTLQEFLKSFEGVDSESLPEGQDPSKMKNELGKAVEKLANSEEFVDSVKEQAGLKEQAGSEELSQDQIKKAAEKVVFLDAKKKMEKEAFGGNGMQKAMSDFKIQMGKDVVKMLPTEAGMKILKSSKEGKELEDFVEKTKQKFSIT